MPMEALDDVIGRLAAEVRPVRRLRSPMKRAALWLWAVGSVLTLAVLSFGDLSVVGTWTGDEKLMLELVGTFLTGVAAVVAAFHLSLPDRSPAWTMLPLPPFVLWIASSGYSCYRYWITFGASGWSLGESANCFRFILGVSLPLAVALFLVLRRAQPLAPVRVAITGGLGVAAISALLLQFFHPFEVTFMDLGVHAAAIGLVMTGSAMSARRWC